MKVQMMMGTKEHFGFRHEDGDSRLQIRVVGSMTAQRRVGLAHL
jgi:hypothetical protein